MATYKKIENIEKPPGFKSWKGWYLLVLGNLTLLILLFYLFTKIFE